MVDGVPYAFFGHSLGALVAYETARKLEADMSPGRPGNSSFSCFFGTIFGCFSTPGKSSAQLLEKFTWRNSCGSFEAQTGADLCQWPWGPRWAILGSWFFHFFSTTSVVFSSQSLVMVANRIFFISSSEKIS